MYYIIERTRKESIKAGWIRSRLYRKMTVIARAARISYHRLDHHGKLRKAEGLHDLKRVCNHYSKKKRKAEGPKLASQRGRSRMSGAQPRRRQTEPNRDVQVRLELSPLPVL